MNRLLSLLLALGMFLGVIATGCSDKDRDSSKPTPDNTKRIVFVYEKEHNKILGNVPANAEAIQATAIDKDGVVIVNGAELDTTVVAEQLEEDGKYYAYTTVSKDADKVIYSFYYTDEGGKKISTYICTLPGVADLDDSAAVTENDVVIANISAECYNDKGQKQDVFQVGDTLQLKAFSGTEDITDFVSFSAYDEAVVKPIDGRAGYFSALGNGETYFDIEFQGITVTKYGPVVVGDAPTPTLDKLLLCPKGYSVKTGDLYDDQGEVVLNYESLPANIDDLNRGDNYTFVVAGVYSDKVVKEMTADDVTLTASNSQATVEGLTITVNDDAAGNEVITAKHGSAELESNKIEFKVADVPAPVLDRLLLCPNGYKVEQAELVDDAGNVVPPAEYDNLPTDIPDLIQNESYKFFVAGVYSDATVRELTASDATLKAEDTDLVTVTGFEVTAVAGGDESVYVETTDPSLQSNKIEFKVVEPELWKVYIFPDGFHVGNDGKVYDGDGNVIDVPSYNWPSMNAHRGEVLKFSVIGLYTTDGSDEIYRDETPETAELYCSIAPMALIDGFTATMPMVDGHATIHLGARHTATGKSCENEQSIDIVPPTMEKLVLCDDSYSVKDYVLYDDYSQTRVEDYSNLRVPYTVVVGSSVTVKVIGVYSDGYVADMSGADVYVTASGSGQVDVGKGDNNFTLTGVSEGTAYIGAYYQIGSERIDATPFELIVEPQP